MKTTVKARWYLNYFMSNWSICSATVTVCPCTCIRTCRMSTHCCCVCKHQQNAQNGKFKKKNKKKIIVTFQCFVKSQNRTEHCAIAFYVWGSHSWLIYFILFIYLVCSANMHSRTKQYKIYSVSRTARLVIQALTAALRLQRYTTKSLKT